VSSTHPLGSAGPERDSFGLTQNATGQAMEEKSTWVTEYADVVKTLEEQERDEMWAIMKECLDGYADEGNVQMCAALAMAAHKELDLSPERLERIVLGYLGS
jgi:WD repeat-containing protein 24